MPVKKRRNREANTNMKLFPLFLMFVLLPALASADINDDLLQYFTVDNDETIGTTSIDSQENENGTLINGVATNVSGIIKQSYGFSTNNDDKYVDIGSDFKPSGTNFSFQVWIFSNDTGLGGVLGDSDAGADGWSLDQVSASRFRFFTLTTNGFIALAGQTLAMNQWRHVVGTYDNVTMRLYINGTEAVAAAQSGALIQSPNNAAFGAYAGASGTSDFDGRLDEIGIWNRTLSPAEVLQLYGNGTGFPFPFDEIVKINNNTYNVTNAIANGTLWRTNTSFPIPINTTTPTVQFTLDSSGNCTIGTQDLNFTDAFSGDSNRLCATLDTTDQTCSLPTSDPVAEGIDLIYLSCVNANQIQIGTSTSGPLFLNVTLPTPPPPNGTGNFSCLIQDNVCINGEFKCLLAVDGNGNEIESKEAFNITCSSLNINNTAFLAIFYLIALVFIFTGARFRSPMLGVIGSMIGTLISITFMFQFALLSAMFIAFFVGVGIAYMFSMAEGN